MNGLKIKNVVRVVNAMVIYQLVFSPLQAYAENQNTSAMDVIGGVLGAAGGVANSMNQQQMQNQQATMQMQQIQAIIPQTAQDDIFPMCKILPAKGNHLSGLCSEPISSVQVQQSTLQIIAAAQSNANAYQNFIIEGLKIGSDQASSCYNDQNKLLKQKFSARKMLLENYKKLLAEQNQKILKKSEDMKNAIKNLTAELDGGDGANTDKKARDFSVFLNDKACRQVLNQKDINANKKIGLRDLRAKSEESLTEAQKTISSKEEIEKDARDQVDGVAKYLKQNGVQGLKSLDITKIGTPSSFFSSKATFESSLKIELNDQVLKLNQVESDIKMYSGLTASDVALSTPDSIKSQFKLKMANIKRDKLRQCSFDASSGVSTETLLSNLEQVRTRSQGTTRNTFRNKMVAILGGQSNAGDSSKVSESINTNSSGSSKSIDTIIAEIEKQENTFGYKEITLKTNTSFAGRPAKYDWSISELLKEVKNSCESRFKNTKLDEFNGLTQNEVFAKAESSIAQYEKLENEASNQITHKMLDRVLNCTGINETSGPDTCNSEGMLNRAGPNFCVKNANNCANSIQSCYNTIDKVVKTKENQRAKIALAHNKYIMDQAAAHDRNLKAKAAEFVTQSSSIAGFFPGTTFDLPSDAKAFLVEVPKETMDEANGVALIEPAGYMEQSIQKLDDIIKQMDAQEKKISDMIAKRVEYLKTVYQTEADYWTTLATQCTNLNRDYKKAQADAFAAAQKQQAEDQKALNDFCYNANNISYTPGCDDDAEDLSDAAQKVANRLSVSDQQQVATVKSYCRNISKNPDAKEVNQKTVYDWCIPKNGDIDACTGLVKAYKDEQKTCTAGTTTTTTGSSEEKCDKEMILDNISDSSHWRDAYDEYNKAKGISDTSTTDLGQKPPTFASCNSINTGTNVTKGAGDVINEFIKLNGAGSIKY